MGHSNDPDCSNANFITDTIYGQFSGVYADGVITYEPVPPSPFNGNVTIFSYSQALSPEEGI